MHGVVHRAGRTSEVKYVINRPTVKRFIDVDILELDARIVAQVFQVGKLYQGIYVGAGPYLSAGTTFTIDPALLDRLPAPDGNYFLVPKDSTYRQLRTSIGATIAS